MFVESGKDWKFSDIEDVYNEIDLVQKEMGIYDFYPNQIEVIGADQMLDCYSSIGMPIFYKHWSFGKHLVRNEYLYKTGKQGLAYEIVINSNPCVSYLMEQNSLLMQTLVIAHAAIGHNHFFKNNHVFKEWTQANHIIGYLDYAKNYVMKCEQKYGVLEVEKVLDAAHALMNVSVFRYPRKGKLSPEKLLQQKIEKVLEEESSYNDLWRTVPQKETASTLDMEWQKRKAKLNLPEENILYFIEQYSPKLAKWQREILSIVRNIAQYFHPQGQTKMMNEGCATYTHYEILHKLYEKGKISDGAMIEFYGSHNGVVYQPTYDHPHYGGINPYALGFAMMKDIERMCYNPTEEDEYYFPKVAGCKDHLNVLKDAWENYRDESFIRQYLSPKVMRDFKFFSVITAETDRFYHVKNIHNERGYEHIKKLLAEEHSPENRVPQIDIVDVDLEGDRTLKLRFTAHDRKRLETKDKLDTIQHLADLWGYNVTLTAVGIDGQYINPDYGRPSNDVPMDDCYIGCFG